MLIVYFDKYSINYTNTSRQTDWEIMNHKLPKYGRDNRSTFEY